MKKLVFPIIADLLNDRFWHETEMLPQSPDVCCWVKSGSRVSGL
jgi:hypothetical protein